MTYLLTNSLERFQTFLPAIFRLLLKASSVSGGGPQYLFLLVEKSYSGNNVGLSPFVLPFFHSFCWPLVFLKVGFFVFVCFLLPV